MQTTGRRERVRQATLTEIRAAARRILIEHGPAAVTINAVAREMGMSGPALYRYYASHEDLVAAMVADFYLELTEVLKGARDTHAADPPGQRLLAICRAMRAWATGHPAEFGRMFASPIPPDQRRPDSPRHQADGDFGHVFLDQFAELWETAPYPVPAPETLAPSLLTQLRAYCAAHDDRLPPEAAYVMLTCWTRVYGLLCMEILHQLDFAFSDVEPVFEDCLRELCASLGVDYRHPRDHP